MQTTGSYHINHNIGIIQVALPTIISCGISIIGKHDHASCVGDYNIFGNVYTRNA